MSGLKFDTDKLPLDLVDAGFYRAVYCRTEVQQGTDWLSQAELLADAMQLSGDNVPGHYADIANRVSNLLADTVGKPVTHLALVLQFGAKKYAAHNWRKGIPRARVLAACLRHIHAATKNNPEKNDPETGLPHLAHALCCLMFLWRYVVDGVDLPDDRWAKKEEPKPLDIGTKARRGDVVRYLGGQLALANFDGLFTASETVARRPADLPAEYVAAEVLLDWEPEPNRGGARGPRRGEVVWVKRTGDDFLMWNDPSPTYHGGLEWGPEWFRLIP